MVAVFTPPVVATGATTTAAAALTRGSIVQAAAVTTPGLTAATPLASVSVPPFGPVTAEPGSQIIVDWTETYQVWLGAGGAMTDAAAYELMTNFTPAARLALLTEMYGANGCSTMRICMGTSDYTSRAYYTYADNGGTADANLTSFSIANDQQYLIPLIQQVLLINPRLHIIAAPWSPPVWMKSANGSDAISLTNGNFNGTVANFTTYAQYFVKFIQAYAALGIPIWAVTAQNEPNYPEPGPSGQHYPGCGWAAADLATFIGTYLGPAFDTAGITTKIFAGDAFWQYPTYAQTCLASTTAKPFIAGTAWHGYGGTPLAQLQANRAYPGTEAHMTEWLVYFADSTATAVDHMAGVAGIASVRYGASSITLWNIVLDQSGLPWEAGATSSTCRGIVTVNSSTGAVTKNIEYYVLAHICKFVQPGARRCKSNSFVIGAGTADVSNVAFLNPDGTVVVFAYNAATTSRTITLTDAITGESFPFTMAAKDITTFKWGSGAAVAAGSYVAPSKPQSFTATSGTNSVTYAWTAPATAGSSDIGGYVIYRGTTAGGESTVPLVVLPPGTVSYIDTSGTVGTTYYATVAAFGAGGYSPVSNEASAAAVATAPPKPAVSVVAGNAQNTVTISVASNGGSAMVSYALSASTTSGGETALTTISSTALSVTYTHTGLTNGTAEYYTATATNGIGTSAASAEASGTPTAAVAAPAHYLVANGTAGSAGIASPPTSMNVTDGFVEIVAWMNLSTYTPSKVALIVGNYLASGGTASRAQWGLILNTDGTLAVYLSSASAFKGYASTASVSTATPSTTTGIWVHAVVNIGTAAIADSKNVSQPAGTVNFYTSTDGVTRTALGTQVTAVTTGFTQPTSLLGYYIAGAASSVSLTGNIYKVLAYGSSARVLLNPDFTAQPTTAAGGTFVDTAAVPNTWTLYSPDSIT